MHMKVNLGPLTSDLLKGLIILLWPERVHYLQGFKSHWKEHKYPSLTEIPQLCKEDLTHVTW